MIVALAGAVLAGCSEDFMSEAVLQPEVPTVRLAVDHAETRASLDGVSVSWEAGDKISVNGTTYTLQGSESEGWYVDVAEAASYEAVYPASAVRSDGLLMLPAVQHYTAGSFDAAAHLMTASAQSVGEGLQFRNQCALLKLSLTGAATVERIVLTGNNGEYLAGPGERNDTAGMVPDQTSMEAVRWIRLDFDEGAALTSEPLVCYLVVPVQEFAKGFSLEIHTSDGMMMEQSTALLQRLVRSGILSMPAFEVKGTMRVLTFEDEDARFEAYTISGCGKTVATWSELIDSPQYGGPLTYNDFAITGYKWHDAGNTELASEIIDGGPFWNGGHVLSNYFAADFKGLTYTEQLTVSTGTTGAAGHGGSANFCVQNGYVDETSYKTVLPSFYFADGKARVVDHMYVVNTCYTLNSLYYGDSFAKPATADSWFKIVAYGYDADGRTTGSTECFLCNGSANIVEEWTKFDLSVLGSVTKIEFNIMGSSDLCGDYGLNTPAYFAYDDVAVRFE